VKGEEQDILVVDDYGHHPNEIAAVLRAAREHAGRRVVVLFQPHRYTRTRDLLPEFTNCFADADLLFVAPIYAASEDPIPGVSAEAIAEAVTRGGHPDCRAVADLAALPGIVRPELRPGDVVITLGAGDIYKSGEILLKELARTGSEARR
jgi:UDP-N-acetylmuramate--alanine ligase